MPRVPPVTSATRAMIPSLKYRLLMGRQTTDDRGRINPCHSSAICRLSSDFCRLSLNTHRNAHAAADAQRGEALLGIALLHLVKQRHQHAGARGADRMANGDGAAVDVDLAGIPAEILVD